METVLQMAKPKTKDEMRRFLGMVGWMRKFIPKLSLITVPFSALMKKDAEYVWSTKLDLVFEEVRTAIAQAKLLAHPNPKQPFTLYCDASDYALGAVLMQRNSTEELVPIEFASRKFTDNEKHWHVSEKEFIAIICAIERWRRFLFAIYTDHKNLKELFDHGLAKHNSRFH